MEKLKVIPTDTVKKLFEATFSIIFEEDPEHAKELSDQLNEKLDKLSLEVEVEE